MKKSIVTLGKRCFLFYILFKFFTLAVSIFSETFWSSFSNIRVLDLSFYELKPVYFEMMLLIMNLYVLCVVSIRYFRLMLSFVNPNEEKYEAEIPDKKEILFNNQIMSIVKCLITSIFISFIVQFIGMFNRY